MHHRVPSGWKGIVFGAIGGAAGMLAMRAYWRVVFAVTGSNPWAEPIDSDSRTPHSISVAGRRYEDGESSTAAAGRIIYQFVIGSSPDSHKTRRWLSELAHWSYALVMSAAYGAIRGRVRTLDISGGLAFGTILWVVDALGTPLLGLGKWPMAYSLRRHAYHCGVHLAYGLANSTTTQVLHRLV